MNITFDSTKDDANQIKHGCSLSDAHFIEWETLVFKLDDRFHYGEIRFVGYAYIGLRLYCVVYTDRDDQRRIISLRKANNREIKNYAST
ncbi:MAG: hypothetical protein CTY13_05205 [Methylobacter sp.]|nr:MAG: hypothetical protein CTY13_05205 [Methylobacter sp.]